MRNIIDLSHYAISFIDEPVDAARRGADAPWRPLVGELL